MIRPVSARAGWLADPGAADCPICKSIVPAYQNQLRNHAPSLDGFWVSDGADMAAYPGYAEVNGLDQRRDLISQELGMHFQIRQLPRFVRITHEGEFHVHSNESI